jgi:dihydroorotate dehydrogenase
MKKVIISAPFGNYLKYSNCTSTYGTFTWAYRGSFWYRIWRMIRTLRYDRRTGGWVNKLGLPNPGIMAFYEDLYKNSVNRALFKGTLDDVIQDTDTRIVVNGIVSLHGFNSEDWRALLDQAAVGLDCTAFELNVSCPNVTDSNSDHLRLFHDFKKIMTRRGNETPLIIKIPPVNYRGLVDAAIDAGIFNFHACNTLPCKSGGMSGPILRPFVLEAIQYIRNEITDPTIIAGGGVRSVEDAQDYLDAGAKHVAIGSALLNPRNLKLPEKIATEL